MEYERVNRINPIDRSGFSTAVVNPRVQNLVEYRGKLYYQGLSIYGGPILIPVTERSVARHERFTPVDDQSSRSNVAQPRNRTISPVIDPYNMRYLTKM
jgi:hypothetical protein